MAEERKLVTILFADVTGSTALGESLDPEDVRALMTRYFEHARRVMSERACAHSGARFPSDFGRSAVDYRTIPMTMRILAKFYRN